MRNAAPAEGGVGADEEATTGTEDASDLSQPRRRGGCGQVLQNVGRHHEVEAAVGKGKGREGGLQGVDAEREALAALDGWGGDVDGGHPPRLGEVGQPGQVGSGAAPAVEHLQPGFDSAQHGRADLSHAPSPPVAFGRGQALDVARVELRVAHGEMLRLAPIPPNVVASCT